MLGNKPGAGGGERGRDGQKNRASPKHQLELGSLQPERGDSHA